MEEFIMVEEDQQPEATQREATAEETVRRAIAAMEMELKDMEAHLQAPSVASASTQTSPDAEALGLCCCCCIPFSGGEI